MRPKADPSTDSWIGIQDARKRKQIQDRLAQRARRQRLAKAAKPMDSSSNSSDSGSSLTLLVKAQAPVSRCSLPLKVDGFLGSSLPTGSTQGSCHSVPQCASISHPGYMSSPPLSTPAASTSPGIDHCLLPLPHLTVYSAMYTNGRMLGIPCVTSLEAKSAVAPPEIPLTLQPIPTQLNIVHFLFIDRFPLARLRHNMIMLSDNFSAEEFIADLFTMPSFTITSGYHCWDPKGWVVDPEFKLKWEFLFR
ncbi:hypothetical protein L207DRAFT_628509 [Hyaloscypha variabilis F]|uniref:BZIP domain-containing protein n=1 Tax=Hyaloscypha variabilis (strain UAMH 11265 / GT02V1 / F) TaxID=1149755 RepID=A0A2J6SB16_HYAVF|nr:hypothetical protein L207DRAFT_628509 [Hyaloscypha variabilis F]